MERKLTKKQKVFADNYIKTLNATQSALSAGYSKRSIRSIASQNLTKPNIKAYIDKRLNKQEKERVASADEVLEYLTSVLRGEAKEETLTADGTAETIAKIRDRTKAAELLGKRHRLFEETTSGSIPTINLIGFDKYNVKDDE